MPVKEKKKGFSLQGFDVSHYQQTEAYVQAIDQLYAKAVQEFALLASNTKINPDKMFSFSDYPSTRAKAEIIIGELAAKMKGVIVNGSRNQWLYACKKNDEFLSHILNTSQVPKKTLQKWQDQNLEALSSFQTRKVAGMDLSKRIWNYAGQMKTQMELGIDIALGEGNSANVLSKELRQYLVDPDKLFRRVRDKHGNLKLSKAAAAYHPGQGKYRSSYKNAMRLTRSEINMAYRTADQLRWQKLDFVVGFEIKLSNNHTLNGEPFVDICDKLAGRYPKSFMFKGWHPQCRCHAVPIMMDRQEFNTNELGELKAALKGTEYKPFESKNTVRDVPDAFKEWIADNLERSQGWKSQPYFIKDNFVSGTLAGGLKVAEIVKNEPIKPEIKAEMKPIETVSKKMPVQLSKESDYLKGKKIEFKKDFFDLIDETKPISLSISKRGKGSCYEPLSRKVNIVDNERNKASDWHRESIVYHEYGHAIDWQRNLRNSTEVKDLMNLHRDKLGIKTEVKVWNHKYDYERRKYVYEKSTVKMAKIGEISSRLDAIYKKIHRMQSSVFTKRGISKHDVLEQIGSVQDTIKSINNSHGWGHSTAYFKRPGMKEAEFLAHCFENSFAGNPVFKKYLPDLYEDMVRYIKSL